MHAAFIYGSFSVLAIASIYLLIRNRLQFILYSVVIFSVLVQSAGAFFKILHLNGGDQLFTMGFVGMILGGALLIWKGLKNSINQILFNKLAAGILIFAHTALFFFPAAQVIRLEPLTYYPITALIATVLINDQTEHQGEKNMLILFLLQGIFQIISNLLKVL